MKSGWNKITPIRTVNEPRLGPMLCDIAGQLQPGEMEASDLVEWAHEGTHAVNNRIRNMIGSGFNAFYVGDGNAMLLREPAMSKTDVANEVPDDERGEWFALYVSGQPAWDRQPLYVLDELTAYENGAITGFETGSDQAAYQLKVATEFIAYARAIERTVERLDPSYCDRKLLSEYITWSVEQIERIRGNQ